MKSSFLSTMGCSKTSLACKASVKVIRCWCRKNWNKVSGQIDQTWNSMRILTLGFGGFVQSLGSSKKEVPLIGQTRQCHDFSTCPHEGLVEKSGS